MARNNGYAVIYQDTIWGVGLTRDEAKRDSLKWLNSGCGTIWTVEDINDVDRWVNSANNPHCVRASQELVEQVTAHGSVRYDWA
jgi:hypothetical protein